MEPIVKYSDSPNRGSDTMPFFSIPKICLKTKDEAEELRSTRVGNIPSERNHGI